MYRSSKKEMTKNEMPLLLLIVAWRGVAWRGVAWRFRWMDGWRAGPCSISERLSSWTSPQVRSQTKLKRNENEPLDDNRVGGGRVLSFDFLYRYCCG
jgi:hypothetical protein